MEFSTILRSHYHCLPLCIPLNYYQTNATATFSPGNVLPRDCSAAPAVASPGVAQQNKRANEGSELRYQQ